MKKNVSFIDEFAVSEVVGAMILVLIAVVVGAAIYMYVFPLPIPAPEPTVKLKGYVTDDGIAVLEHMGGESLSAYRIVVRQIDGTLINTTTYQNKNDSWKIGKCNYPPTNMPLLTESDKVNIDVYEINKDGREDRVFTGILTGKRKSSQPYIEPMLISSLKTNTIDEDLICYNHTINPNIHASAYIYNWSANGNSIANLLMPFDTDNSTIAKDYSGNKKDGTIIGPIWINGGRIGGAYQFDGINDRISIPYCFDSSTINKITVETWIKTTANSGVIASFDRNDYWELGFINGKVRWSTTASDGLTDTIGKTSINNGIWHHIAATYDYSTGECAIYIDGKQDTTEDGHRLGELLGLGGMPQGSIGTSVGVTRKTIFSTSFETQNEKNNWSENNSGATNIKDCVDNDVSNVDSSADNGTETNFANAQGASPDGNVMTIGEANIGGSSAGNENKVVDSKDTTYTQWTRTGTTPYLNADDHPTNYISTSTRNINEGWFTFADTTAPAGATVTCTIYVNGWRSNTNGADDYADVYVDYTGSGGSDIGDACTTINSNGVQTINVGSLTVTQANALRVYFRSTRVGSAMATLYIDYVYVNFQWSAVPNYQIDFEYQWTAAVHNMVNEQVCIYVGSHTGSENLLVNYWTGSAWSLLGTITVPVPGWFNFTATGLTSSTYTIQLKGALESSDTSRDSWNIDAALLHLWTPQGIFDILPSTVLTPKTGSYSIGGAGDFDPYYTAFNRTGIDISGYTNVKVSVWYSYNNTESNDFLGLYYKNNSEWKPIFNVSGTQIQAGGGQKPWAQVVINISKSISTLVLQFKWRTTATNEYVAIDNLEITGVPLGFGDNFSGTIDEFHIYNRPLSAEQIYQNYLCTKDGYSDKSVIVSEEIKLSDIWKCVVTPNDGIQDDISKQSNIIQIVAYPGGD